MSLVVEVENYIGGSFRAPISGQYLDNVEPATDELLSRIPSSDSVDANAAVEAAQQAYLKLDHLDYLARAELLEAVASEIERRFEEFALMESRDTGKPLWLTKLVDIPRAIANFRFFAGAIRHDSTQCHEMRDALNYSQRSPVGVCVLITPWNLPLYLLSWKVAPALAMGNTVVAKPSEVTPMTAHLLAEVFHALTEQGRCPAGVYNVVHGLGAQVGSALVGHPDAPLVSFTGGTVTGKIVARTAAPMFKKLSLELGGKNASIVFADCDMEETVREVARASFANQGQICLCGSRILVERAVYDDFKRRFVAHVSSTYTCGHPQHSEAKQGSLVSQLHRHKVESYVRIAREEGGVVLCGGKRPDHLDKGAFYMPTVIEGLDVFESRVATEEVFGPVVTLHPFDSESDAVRMANCVQYGLAGSVWTANLKRAHRVARLVDSGMIWVNCWLHRDLRVPFGGHKNSGEGVEGGDHSLRFYSQIKNICIKY